MAFTELDIQIQEILTTDFIPDFLPEINTNNSKLKQEIEKIVNNLEIDTTNKKIGSDTPIGSVNSRRYESLADQLTNDGYYLMKTTGSTRVVMGHLKRGTISLGVEGSELMVDKLIVNSVIEASGASGSWKDIEVLDSFTSDTLTTLKGYIDVQGGISKSLDFNLVVDFALDAGVAVGRLNLTRTSQENLFVTLKMDTTVYSGAWALGLTDMKLFLDLDSTNPSLNGQAINVYIAKIVDNSGVEIVGSLPAGVALKLYPGDDNSVDPVGSLVFTDATVTAIEIIATAGAIVKYKKNIELIQVVDGTTKMFHIRSVYN